ncbi:MAG: hypothetical protein LLF84_00675 [Methanoregulaceae archaeon]|nr:hypothetical protein [Methanoregulaceae archaeon]
MPEQTHRPSYKNRYHGNPVTCTRHALTSPYGHVLISLPPIGKEKNASGMMAIITLCITGLKTDI